MNIDVSEAKQHLNNIRTLLRDDTPQPLEQRHIDEARAEADYALAALVRLELRFQQLTVTT